MAIFFLAAARGTLVDATHANDTDWTRRLRAEAIVAWRALAEKFSQSGFEYAIVETQRNGRTPLERRKHVAARLAGECFLAEETIVATDQVSIYGRNERYEFALERSGESPWTVSWQSGLRDDDTPVESARAYLAGLLQLPWSISEVPLERLVVDPRFSIRSARTIENGRIEIQFAVAPTEAAADDLQRLRGGTLVLDPTRQWAVVRYQAQYGNRMWSTADLSYSPSGPPELRRVRFELHTAPERSSRFAIEVARYDWTATASSEFTLSAFGLPEYQEPGARRRWLPIVNLGVVFLLVGLILWRRRRRIEGMG